jgi:eukaryotic-like serine/threonine-protein kinase
MTLSGNLISHYQTLRQLGKGGMGEVWLAHDTVLDRQVAIKFLPENLQADPTTKERFLREAKAAAALDHPFICKIYETGESGGRTYIVMEYVEGCNLQDKMKEAEISARDALQIALEVAEALEVAHAKGIVHRDLKPANIMCTPQGHAKVMDFGIAKRILPGPESAQATLTQTGVTAQGMIMGTIDYMSPEQARGVPVDGRSDIFSLGVILYEMLSGKHPFAKLTPIETLTSVLKDPVPSFVVKPKNINPAAHYIIKKCLAKKPEDRYANIKEFSAEIRKVRDEVVGKGWIFPRRWQAIAAAALAVLVVFLVLWRFVFQPRGPSAKSAPESVSVLVADFDNRTGETVFNGAVEQALILGLEDASFINIYKREDARKKAGQLDPNSGGKLDTKLGQLVCRSEGIPVLVEGSIENGRSGDYRVKVKAVDPVSSTVITEREKKVSKKADVMNAAAALSLPLCEELGGKGYEAAGQLSVETFTTSSLEAMNAYARAQESIKQGKRPEAIEEYQRAIKEDPNFGRAYSGLAVAFQNAGELKKAAEYQQLALARLDSMNDREKFRTRGIWYLMTKNYQKAIEEFSALVGRFPGDSAGHNNLAYAYYIARDMAKAVEHGLHYVKIYPKNINGQGNLAWYAIGAGDFAMALVQAKKALELNPKFEKACVCAALSEIGQGRSDEAEAWYQKLEPLSFLGASLAAIGRADIALYEGRLSAAAKILENGLEADLKNNKPDMAAEKWIMLGQARLGQGQKSKAVEAADRAIALIPEVNIAFPAAEIYSEGGKDEKAEALAKDFEAKLEPEPRAYAKLIEGLLAEKKGRTNEAITAFIEAQNIVDTWIGRLALGRAYLKAGAFAEAHSELEKCDKRRGEAAAVFLNDIPSFRYVPQVYYYLGRAQEGLKSPAAKESYQKFLKIKEKAEAGDPLVEDARKRTSKP